ncbi:MAG: hypothetical protein MUF49_30730 [Oculatellaceae cyanobacterium Prado106]|jgi:hypothetical protein|nr:hypothetical protein [Oculatellaceae cyanobacterium Prado106]
MTPQPLEDRTQHLEERITALEAELLQLKQMVLQGKQMVLQGKQTQVSGWDSVFGSFANCPEFDEMERLGREWRVSQQDSLEEMIEEI